MNPTTQKSKYLSTYKNTGYEFNVLNWLAELHEKIKDARPNLDITISRLSGFSKQLHDKGFTLAQSQDAEQWILFGDWKFKKHYDLELSDFYPTAQRNPNRSALNSAFDSIAKHQQCVKLVLFSELETGMEFIHDLNIYFKTDVGFVTEQQQPIEFPESMNEQKVYVLNKHASNEPAIIDADKRRERWQNITNGFGKGSDGLPAQPPTKFYPHQVSELIKLGIYKDTQFVRNDIGEYPTFRLIDARGIF